MAASTRSALGIFAAVLVCGLGAGTAVAHSSAAAKHSSGPSKRHAKQKPRKAKKPAQEASIPLSRQRVRTTLRVPAGNGVGGFAVPETLTVPPGWKVVVWALVPSARWMTWTPQGALLVSTQAGTVVELAPNAHPALPPRQSVLLSGLTVPQGMAFDKVNGQTVLYVAESDQIDRYVWRGAAGVGARTVLVPNLPDLDPHGDDVHRAKTLVVGPDHRIYVMIGSAYNASPLDIQGNPPRASVVSYGPNGGNMRVLATGVRNGEGLSFAPNGVLWSAINERDQIAYPFHQAADGLPDAFGQIFPAYVSDHPSDEVVALTPGRNVGWPYCDPDPNNSMSNLGFDDDFQTNLGGSQLNCAKLTPINRGLPAHSAPLGLNFLEGSALPGNLTQGAVLAVHGSWDRNPPRPPAVLWMPWSKSQHTLGPAVTLISGFQNPDGSRWGRPADVVPGADGDLYVSDDTAGAIYRVIP
jgi:glucose/arabinose dehydrogenase